jgi:hypothetical protein
MDEPLGESTNFSEGVMEIQEMYNRAVIGLRSQNWERAVDEDGNCVYCTTGGAHCAWGWVDPAETKGKFGSVATMKDCGVGIAAGLSDVQLTFALALQSTHDSKLPGMEARLRDLGHRWRLDWPEVQP